jgi:hypothetical protein
MPFESSIEGVASMTPEYPRGETKLLTAVEIAQRDTDRQNKRREIRRQMAHAEMLCGRAGLIDQQIARLDERLNESVAAHQAACLPAQTRITEIEAAITDCLMQRKPVPAELESERVELMAVITAANEKLETESIRTEKLRSPLWNQSRELKMSAAEAPPESALVRLGCPQLVAEMEAAAAVQTRLGTWRDRLANEVARYPRESERLSEELKIVEAMLAKANSDAEASYRAVIGE